MNKRAVGIVIKDSQIVLIHRFAHDKEYWVFPGGGLKDGETEEEAMKREVQEELSFTVLESKPLFEVFNEFTMGMYPPRQEYYYLVTGFTGELKLGGEEAQRMNEKDQYYPTWVDLAKLKEMDNLVPEVAKEKLVEVLDSI